MKNINVKINLILLFGFLIQLILILSLYRMVVANNILNEINSHEAARQRILDHVVAEVEKMNNNPTKIKDYLQKYAKEYDIKFVLKDIDENIVFKTFTGSQTHRTIKEMDFIKFYGRPTYFVTAYYPAQLKTLTQNAEDVDVKLLLLFIIFVSSIITSILIYRILTIPVRKISKAVKDINYGNTVVQIPYYSKDEIGQLCRNFEDMGARLKQSEETQVELVQAISHDLKTPLTSIIGYIKRLSDGKVNSDERKQEYYETIYRKAEDIKGLVEELEDYSRASTIADIDANPVDCEKFFYTTSEELKNEILQRDHNFISENNITEPCKIRINEGKLKRVIFNIIENAIKYGGEYCMITFRCNEKNDHIVFELEDNGPGVPEEHLDKIFERFYRVENSRSREKGGTGLGLAICKEIIEAHGGRIGARSTLGHGLTIYFTIPIFEEIKE